MKDDRFYLLHVQDACEQIVALTHDGQDAFQSDRRTQDAMIRNFQIIGEAVKNVSSALKEREPDVPWRSISGMRDRLVHDYFEVDLDVVWDTATKHVPLLLDHIRGLIANFGESTSAI